MNLEKMLQSKKKSITPERKLLFEKMKSFHIFSARDISESFPKIPRASIFRTIKLFCEIWVLRRVSLESGVEQYEIDSHENHHEHMKCETCGTVLSFESDFICKLLKKVAKNHNFSLREHSINLFGNCENCS